MQNSKCIYNEQNSVIKYINSSKLSSVTTHTICVCCECDNVMMFDEAKLHKKLNVTHAMRRNVIIFHFHILGENMSYAVKLVCRTCNGHRSSYLSIIYRSIQFQWDRPFGANWYGCYALQSLADECVDSLVPCQFRPHCAYKLKKLMDFFFWLVLSSSLLPFFVTWFSSNE